MIGAVLFAWLRVVPPLLDVHVAVKPVIGTPLPLPAVNDTFSCPEPTFTAAIPVGGDGAPTVTADDAADASPAPCAFVAMALHM